MRILLHILTYFIFSSVYSQDAIPFKSQRLINPSYFNENSNLSASMHYRNQWTGMNGAPISQALNVNYTIEQTKGMSVGMSLFNHKIGLRNLKEAFLNVSYLFKTSSTSRLSLGTCASLAHQYIDLSKIVSDNGQADNQFTEDNSFFTHNVGFGLFFKTPHFFLAYSVPKLLYTKNVLETPTFNFNTIYSYFLIGKKSKLADNITSTPSLTIRYMKDSPFLATLSWNFLVADRIGFGVGWRYTNAYLMNFEYKYKQLAFEYSYTYTMIPNVNSVENTTHEISLSWTFLKDNNIPNLRDGW